MKKNIYLFALLLTAAFAACSADYDEPEQPTTRQNETPADSTVVNPRNDSTEVYKVISTVPVSDDVKQFFDEAVPFSYDKPAYFKPYVDLGADQGVHILNQWVVYSVFNSKEEMRKQYIGNADLPELDFEKYTLVIGTSYMDATDSLKAIEVRSYGEQNELTVFIELRRYGQIEFYPFRFWAVFPKIQGSINHIYYTRKDKDGKESY